METQELLCKLKCQHEKFANEIIHKLKYCFRLHEDEPYPKEIVFASSKMCDAIIAISYLLRYYYRGVYYYLRDELKDLKEFEKFCFSLPVLRSKRFSFYFLLRISFLFEITMYLFKAGYDYFHIAHKCFAAFPDPLYFHAVGGWARLHNISAYILHVTKVSKKRIVAEHPLVGNFIEERSDFYDPLYRNYLYNPILLMDPNGVPTFKEEEFFNPKDSQAHRVVQRHFLASPKPEFKYRAKDILKFNDIFPLKSKDRVLFQIENESDISSYIVYKLYVEIQQIHTFLQTFMDAESLKIYFPQKSNSENTEENFRFECYGYYSVKIPQKEIESELYNLDHHKNVFPHAYYEENLQIFQYMKDAGNMFECTSSKEEKFQEPIEIIYENMSSLNLADEFDDLPSTEEEFEPLSNENLPNPKYQLIYGNTEDAEIKNEDKKSLNEEESKISQSTSNTSDMKNHEEEIESICQKTSTLKLDDDFEINLTEEECRQLEEDSICQKTATLKLDDDFEINLTEEECRQLKEDIMAGGTESLNEVETKMSQFRSQMGITDAFDDIDLDLYTTEEEYEPLSHDIFLPSEYSLNHGDMENTEIVRGGTKSLNEEDQKISQVTASTSDMKNHKNIESICESITEEYTDIDLLTTIKECEELTKKLSFIPGYMLINNTENTEIMKGDTESLNEEDSEISQSTSSTSDMKIHTHLELSSEDVADEYIDLPSTEEECEPLSNEKLYDPKYHLIYDNIKDAEIKKGETESLNEEESKISQSTSSASDMKIDKTFKSLFENIAEEYKNIDFNSKKQELSKELTPESKSVSVFYGKDNTVILKIDTESSSEEDCEISPSTSSTSDVKIDKTFKSIFENMAEEYKNIDFSSIQELSKELSNTPDSRPKSKFCAPENTKILKGDTKSLNAESKISKSALQSSNEELSKNFQSASNISDRSIQSSNEISEFLQAVLKGNIHKITRSSNKKNSKNPQSTVAMSELPKDKKRELIKIMMDISKVPGENTEILTNTLPTNPIVQNLDQLQGKKSERGLNSALENMPLKSMPLKKNKPLKKNMPLKSMPLKKNMPSVSTATKQMLFKVLGDCSGFSTEERNEMYRALADIPEGIPSGKKNVCHMIKNMDFFTEQEKLDLLKSVKEFTDEGLNEIQTGQNHSSTDDKKILDVFEGIFNNEDDDICEEFRQFVMLCQNDAEVTFEKLQELAASSVKTGFSKKVIEKDLESKQPSRAKPIPEQLSQEKDDDLEDDDHTICRCFEKGRLAAAAAAAAAAATSSNKPVDEHSKNLDVANSSGNRRRRNKKSKKRSKK